MINRLLKQYYIGNSLGAALDVYSRSSIVITIFGNVMLATTFYNTGGREYVALVFPWINLWIFLTMLTVVAVAAMVAYFKWVLPSAVSFGNSQGYAHNNPFKRDMDKANAKLDKVDGRLDAIEKLIKELKK